MKTTEKVECGKLMCSSVSDKYKNAYDAAKNALAYGEDYANGGCDWDGKDLKTKGKKAYRYRKGFRYTSPSHNIFNTSEPPALDLKVGPLRYDYVYDLTVAYGESVFWHYNQAFMKARKVKQCH